MDGDGIGKMNPLSSQCIEMRGVSDAIYKTQSLGLHLITLQDQYIWPIRMTHF
jgi:hypothetical protein